jgi:hypothetical protein
MSKPAYIIRFPSSPSTELVHRVQNWAEDVFLALRDESLGAVPNMDTATTEVRIEVAASRHLGRVLQILRLHLARHNLAESASVSRV